MRTPSFEILASLLVGSILLIVGEAFYANGSIRIAFAFVSGGFLLAPAALAIAYRRAGEARLARAAAWTVALSGAVLVLVHVYGSIIDARTPTMMMIGMPSVGAFIVGLAMGGVALVRAGLQGRLGAVLVPLSVPVWFAAEQIVPAWGGIAGAALFGAAASAQLLAMRRTLGARSASLASRA